MPERKEFKDAYGPYNAPDFGQTTDRKVEVGNEVLPSEEVYDLCEGDPRVAAALSAEDFARIQRTVLTEKQTPDKVQ